MRVLFVTEILNMTEAADQTCNDGINGSITTFRLFPGSVLALVRTRIASGVQIAGLLWVLSAIGICAADDSLRQGEYLLHLGGCIGCHTTDRMLAGGRPIESPFGTFYSPNITSDPEYGIGAWSDEEFVGALREGTSPAGRHYFPAFPYTTYTRMTRNDMLALKAYIMSLPPSTRQNSPHDIPWYVTPDWMMAYWKWRNFKPGAYIGSPAESPEWNRGAYLANALGHCGECHTPRNLFGATRRELHLAGSRWGVTMGERKNIVPNITPDPDTGIGSWERSDVIRLLMTGQRPDGAYTSGRMIEFLGAGFLHMTEPDRNALVTYLLTLPPIYHDVEFYNQPFSDPGYHE